MKSRAERSHNIAYFSSNETFFSSICAPQTSRTILFILRRKKAKFNSHGLLFFKWNICNQYLILLINVKGTDKKPKRCPVGSQVQSGSNELTNNNNTIITRPIMFVPMEASWFLKNHHTNITLYHTELHKNDLNGLNNGTPKHCASTKIQKHWICTSWMTMMDMTKPEEFWDERWFYENPPMLLSILFPPAETHFGSVEFSNVACIVVAIDTFSACSVKFFVTLYPRKQR